MLKFVIKYDGMYYCHGVFSQRITFSNKFEDARFFDTSSEADAAIKEGKLPTNTKVKQVTYVEHDIGYVEHNPLDTSPAKGTIS